METFFSFMYKVLYDEESGYYMQKKHPASFDGDYITASSHPVFVLGMEKFIRNKFKDLKITFVDIGAGDFSLLKKLKKKFKGKEIELIGIEKVKRCKDKEIIFLESLEKLEKKEGIFFSYELFDSLPFHLIKKEKGKIKEIYVQEDRLITGPLSDEKVINYIKENKIELREGQKAEICLYALELYEKILEKLKRGISITFDYGFKSSLLYKSFFYSGTLMTHKEKNWGRNPLKDKFKRDITYAVNFSPLIRKGEELGFKTKKFSTLGSFLVENLGEEIKKIKKTKHPIPTYDLIFGKVGQDIKVLIQEKF